mmetsp:Transcript_34605/g.73899  ORF Transcript_34605/g.73899 Transcript_34605/m.73899 type:complete len:229 (+) Transcript_34605:3-689(+)
MMRRRWLLYALASSSSCATLHMHTRRTVLPVLTTMALPCLPNPAHAAGPGFALALPSSFVRLDSTPRGGVSPFLLVAGDYSSTIRSGGVTSLSVQFVRNSHASMASLSNESPEKQAMDLASTLARLRDAASGLPAGCMSQVLFDSVSPFSTKHGISFELLTPLTNPAATEVSAVQILEMDARLVRHTLVSALPTESGWLVLWAGAQQAEWTEGADAVLRTAAGTFTLK